MTKNESNEMQQPDFVGPPRRKRGERNLQSPTGLVDQLLAEGFVKGDPSFKREYLRRYYHLKRVKVTTPHAAAKRRYGIDRAAFDALWKAADGRCQCCSREVKPPGHGYAKHEVGNVDHCHSTGRVRGILCNRCNQAPGLLYDRPDLAVTYLNRNETTHNHNR